MEMQLMDWVELVILGHVWLLAMILLCYGLERLVEAAIALSVWVNTTLQGRTTPQVHTIRAVGQQARHEMQGLYRDYVAHIKAQKRR